MDYSTRWRKPAFRRNEQKSDNNERKSVRITRLFDMQNKLDEHIRNNKYGTPRSKLDSMWSPALRTSLSKTQTLKTR